MALILAILATLSIWDYPERQPQHDALRRQFLVAMREGDTATMEETCRKGVKLLPDDPVWHYNLACSLAYFNRREQEAFDELEKAIDLGFRDADTVAADTDLKRLAKLPRYAELVEYAKEMRTRPLITGPMATVDATGIFGRPVALGEQNLGWDFDAGVFAARLKLVAAGSQPYVGELYMNRDGGHSMLKVADFPGLTEVKFDKDGRDRKMDMVAPNIIFPYPTFGNSSMAYMGSMWRSIPRSLMTMQLSRMQSLEKMYLSNQLWFFPSNSDTPPVGTNGDMFASIAPYWLTTAGRSYSDQPYLRAALQASVAFKPEVKREIVRRGLLAPTIFTLLRKSMGFVQSEEDYLTRAHPTAMPAGAINQKRLEAAAAAMTIDAIPPLAPIKVGLKKPAEDALWPEITYATAFAWAGILRAADAERMLVINATGAAEFRFVQTHGPSDAVKIVPIDAATVRVKVSRDKLKSGERVDVAVFGRNSGTGWGAPSYVSIARMDPGMPNSDPALIPLAPPKDK